MNNNPKDIPPAGFVAKLPPVGTVFTDRDNPPGPGWLWSDHTTPPRWLPPDASSPHFQQAIEDAHNFMAGKSSVRKFPPDLASDVRYVTKQGVLEIMREACRPEQLSPSPLPQGASAPDPQGQDRGQGEGDALDFAKAFYGTTGEHVRVHEPAPHSAVEWAHQHMIHAWKLAPERWVLVGDDALTLARRCDEAEARAQAAIERSDNAEKGCREQWAIAKDLRAQLGAAQAELTRIQHESTAHRLAWENALARERDAVKALGRLSKKGTGACGGGGGLDQYSQGYSACAEEVRKEARAALAKKEAQP